MRNARRLSTHFFDSQISFGSKALGLRKALEPREEVESEEAAAFGLSELATTKVSLQVRFKASASKLAYTTRSKRLGVSVIADRASIKSAICSRKIDFFTSLKTGAPLE